MVPTETDERPKPGKVGAEVPAVAGVDRKHSDGAVVLRPGDPAEGDVLKQSQARVR